VLSPTMLQTQLAAADKAAAGGRVRHSVCKWCYKTIPLEDMCIAAKEIGLESIELLDPADFATMKKHGLHCAMVSFPTIEGPGGVKIGPIPKRLQPLGASRSARAGLRTAVEDLPRPDSSRSSASAATAKA
jgi:hypothetical protein